MQFSKMNQDEVQKIVNWCRSYDWGKKARYDAETGCIMELDHHFLDESTKEWVCVGARFSSYDLLKSWAIN